MKSSRIYNVFLGLFYILLLGFWYQVFGAHGGTETMARLWFMPLTMIFASFIAGSTSIGGGAIAFPVLTLVLSISPLIARDFSLMIQSVGMTAASLWILKLKVPIETRAIIYGTIGGSLGMVMGLWWIHGLFSPAYIKMFFVCILFTFGCVLVIFKKDTGIVSLPKILKSREKAVLIGFGILGGIVSSLTGSGLDIFLFSALTLYFGICEKVATPTSVILMSINTVLGTSLIYFFGYVDIGAISPLQPQAIELWSTSVPIVIIGAPLGAFFISRRNRGFIVKLLIASIIAQFVAALLIVPHDLNLYLFEVMTLAIGFFLFHEIHRTSQIASPTHEEPIQHV
jgi:uncharacterized protein